MKKQIALLIDFLSVPFTIAAALWLRMVRSIGMAKRPFSRAIFRRIGVFPLFDHFYEPLFSPLQLTLPLNTKRNLPGINWNIGEQLELLEKFDYHDEYSRFPMNATGEREYFVNNSSFGGFVAAYLYSVIRHFKPKRIIEVGSGMSTLLSLAAIKQNCASEQSYECQVTCIEPYSNNWLEDLGVNIIRQCVEDIDAQVFRQLEANDILFIDSSHIIRPQGDVNYLYLEVLPLLNSGVIVHSHDIFTPNDYPYEWLSKHMILWNEQYLLEAFLTCNHEFRVIGGLTYLQQNHYDTLKMEFPMLNKNTHASSFWMAKN